MEALIANAHTPTVVSSTYMIKCIAEKLELCGHQHQPVCRASVMTVLECKSLD